MKPTIRVLAGAVALVAAILVGWCAGRATAPRPNGETASAPAPSPATPSEWTCSMHPAIRLPRAGKCPTCEMPLIPVGASAGPAGGPIRLQLSPHAIAMASIETVPVERRELTRALRVVGKVQYNERTLATITPRVDGYAERLFVDYTGITIKAGEHLAEVYSPDLLVAQQELLIALQGGATETLIGNAKTKLRLLGLTEEQVAALVQDRKVTERVTLYSPITGTVIEKTIVEKAAFRAGDPLYRIANLDTVWAYVDVYEYDLPWVRYGQTVTLTAEALPGREILGMVTFVQPLVDEASRTVRVPVHVDNAGHHLKPGMFVSAVIHAALGPDGVALPTGVEGKFSCPMHPQVLQEAVGKCPLCEMPLTQIPPPPAPPPPAAPSWFCPMKCEGEKTYPGAGKCPECEMALEPVPVLAGKAALAVPVSAVLDSGTRKLVYVARGEGVFEPREVTLGPRAGAFHPVLGGLSGGEQVVVRGNFLLDSQFQITGHPSLFYPGGLHALSAREHGAGPPDKAPPVDPHAGHRQPK